MEVSFHLHILLIHQAFVAIDEPGGTRHHEMAPPGAASAIMDVIAPGQLPDRQDGF
jgi:hypothetical protein